MNKDNLIQLAKEVAKENELDPALVCAVVEQESNWNPSAIRFEPGFYKTYLERYWGPMESLGSGSKVPYLTFSFGLMQVMGQVAKEFGYHDDLIDLLVDPEKALQIGCKVLSSKLKKANGNVENGLLMWNGGGNKKYPQEVLARISKYQEKENESITETKSE